MTNADSLLRQLITEVIRQCPKKRPQIAEEMQAILGQRVTANMLNDFTSEGKKQARFPASFVDAFCLVTGDSRLKGAILGREGSRFFRLGVDVAEMLETRKRKPGKGKR